MQINGTVVSTEFDVSIPKVNGGSYQGSRLMYRDDSGALKEQNFTNQTLKFNPAIKNQLNQLAPNASFTMVKEKEGEFWNVKGIYTEGNVPSQSVSPNTTKAPITPSASPKSNYETPEERAQKQVYIIRQSAVNYAVNASTLLKLKSKEEIVSLAKFFEAYVLGTEFDDGSIMSLKSDEID